VWQTVGEVSPAALKRVEKRKAAHHETPRLVAPVQLDQNLIGEGARGDMLIMPDRRHSLEALEDSGPPLDGRETILSRRRRPFCAAWLTGAGSAGSRGATT
jgi:hypothetical protein